MTRKHHYQNYFIKGWSFEDVLPYFLRAEGYQETLHNKSNLTEKQSFLGKNGDLPIRDSLHLSPLANFFPKMGQKHNQEKSDESTIENGYLDGFSIPQLNIDSFGSRADTYSSFLKGDT